MRKSGGSSGGRSIKRASRHEQAMKESKITLTAAYFGAGPGMGGITQVTIRKRRNRATIWNRVDLTDPSEPKTLVRTFTARCSWRDIAAIAASVV
jgi:hypothetical protein